MIKERFDRLDEQFDEFTENMEATNQRLAGLEHEAGQPRLAAEADVEPDPKTRKCMEDVFAAVRMKDGNSSSVRVDVVVVVVSHIQRIACQPEKNYFTRWPIPLVVC